METSLKSQLNKLRNNITNQNYGIVVKYSLLHDLTTVQSITFEQAYSTAISGLNELIGINSNFEIFKDSIFSEESIKVYRPNMTEAENKKLKRQIKHFLFLVSPYLMLTSSHKVIEWLLNRFSINIYETDLLIYSALPHHETKLFARLMMLIDNKLPTSPWYWLTPVQQQGLPLVQDVLISQCIRSKWWLIIGVCKYVMRLAKYLQKINETGQSHSVIFSFYASLIFSILDKFEDSFHSFIDQLLPFVFNGLKSQISIYVDATVLIIAKICSILTLKFKYAKKIINLMMRNVHISTEAKMNISLHVCSTQNIGFALEDIMEYVKYPDWTNLFTKVEPSIDYTKLITTIFPHLLMISSVCMNMDSFDVNQFYTDLVLFVCHQNSIELQSYFLLKIVTFYLAAENIDENYVIVMKKLVQKILNNFPSIEDVIINQVKAEVWNDRAKNFIEECVEFNFERDQHSILLMPNSNIGKTQKIRIATHLIKAIKSSTLSLNQNNITDSLFALTLDKEHSIVSHVWNQDFEILSKLLSKEQILKSIKHILDNTWSAPTVWIPVLILVLPLLTDEDACISLEKEINKVAISLQIVMLKLLNSAQFDLISFEKLIKISPKNSSFLKATIETIKLNEFSMHIHKKLDEKSNILASFLNSFIRKLICELPFDYIFEFLFKLIKNAGNTTSETSILLLSLIGILFSIDTDFMLHSNLYYTAFHEICHTLLTINQQDIKLMRKITVKEKNPYKYLDCILKRISSSLDLTSTYVNTLFWVLQIVVHKIPIPKEIYLKDQSLLDIYCDLFELLSKGCCSFAQNSTFIKAYNHLFVTVFSNKLTEDVEGLFYLISYYFSHKFDIPIEGKVHNIYNLYLISSIEMISTIVNNLTIKIEISENFKHYFIILLCILSNTNTHVRKSTINHIKIFIKNASDSSLLNIIQLIVNNETMIINDCAFISFIINKIFKSSDTSADIIFSYLCNFMFQSKYYYYSLISLKYLLQAKHRLDMLPFLIKFVQKIVDECKEKPFKLTHQYLELISEYYQNNLPVPCYKDQSFISSILSLSNCQFKIDGTYVSSHMIKRFNNDLYLRFQPSDRVLIIQQWIETIIICKDRQFSQQLIDLIRSLNVDCEIFYSIFVYILIHFKFQHRILNYKISRKIDLNINEYSNVIILTLELLQSGNHFINSFILLPVLLLICEYIMNKDLCIMGTESVDFSIQLCLLAINSLLSKECDKSSSNYTSNILDMISLRCIINIIRSNDNNISHDLALNVLSNSAKLFPNLLLDYIMPLFTFMGSYVIKKDNESTLNNICKTIESVIPAFTEKYDLKKNTMPLEIPDEILKIVFTFIDSFKHVPVHRHRHIFKSLVHALGSYRYLGPVICIILKHMDNNDLLHLFEFCAHLSSHFSINDQFNSISYLFSYLDKQISLKTTTTNGTYTIQDIGQKRKHSVASTTVDDPVSNNLKQKIIKYLEFYVTNDKWITESDISLSIDHSFFPHLIESCFVSIPKFNTSDDRELYDSLKNTFIKLVSNCQSSQFLSCCKVCIINHSDVNIHLFIISMLYNWSSSEISLDSIDSFNDIYDTCINHVFLIYCKSKDPKSNSICKQTLLFVKNIILKITPNSVGTNIFENLLNLSSNTSGTATTITIQTTFNWINCRIFEELNEDSILYLPQLLTNIINFGKSIQTGEYLNEVKSQKIFLLTLFKCIDIIIKKCNNLWNPYLEDILYIICYTVKYTSLISSLTSSDNHYNLIFDQKSQLNSLDLSVLQCIRYISLNISTNMLLTNILIILRSDKSKISINHISLIYIIMNHIKNISPSSAEIDKNSFITLFNYLIDYRNRCINNGIEFIPPFEAIIFDAFCTLGFKLSENIFYEIFQTQFQSVTTLGKNIPSSIIYQNTKLITFYHLTDVLLNKMKNIFILFTPIFIADLTNNLNYFSTNKDFIENSNFELFNVCCKVFKKCFMYDEKSYHSSSMLITSINIVIEMLKLVVYDNDDINKTIDEDLIPTIGYISCCLKSYDSVSQLIHILFKNISHSNEKMRNVIVFSTKTVLNNVSDQATILLPDIIPYLSKSLNDPSTLVQSSAKELYNLIEKITGENLSNYI